MCRMGEGVVACELFYLAGLLLWIISCMDRNGMGDRGWT